MIWITAREEPAFAVDFAGPKVSKYRVFNANGMEAAPMGKGDQKSKRGKIHRGTFGKTRPKPRDRNKDKKKD